MQPSVGAAPPGQSNSDDTDCSEAVRDMASPIRSAMEMTRMLGAASTAAVGWNAILSYRNSRAKLRESRKEAIHDD